jgi:protein AroM
MKTVGVITIGQAPRDDVVPDMEKVLGPEVRILQAGALDGLSHAEVATLAPTAGQFPLITRLLDGTSVVIGKERIIQRLQTCLDTLAGEATAFAIMCTGKFPPFRCTRPVLEPERLLFAIAGAVYGGGHLGVIVPIEAQVEAARAHWGRITPDVTVAVASPYAGAGPLVTAADTLARAHARLVVLDCMGFTQAARATVRDVVGAPVLVGASLIARMIAEVA